MNNGNKTKNHVSYLFSKEVILKDLLEKGVITQIDYDRYDQLLFDRYNISENMKVIRPVIGDQCQASNEFNENSEKYVSLTTIARTKNADSPGYEIQSWLRDGNTLAFLNCWEKANNPSYSEDGYKVLLEERKNSSTTLTVKKWNDMTGAIGLSARIGKNGGVTAHIEIAYEFRAWLNPDLRYKMIKAFLKESGTQEEV